MKLAVTPGSILALAGASIVGYAWYTNRPLTLVPTPVPDSPSVPSSATFVLGERKQVGAIFITIREIVEDSRCATDVVCIQAGTVRVRADIDGGTNSENIELALGKPTTAKAHTVTLTQVEPTSKTSESISSDTYRFSILVEKR